MTCENCKAEFNSLNWYRLLETSSKPIVLCDDCVRRVLEAKIEYHQNTIRYIQERLNMLPKE